MGEICDRAFHLKFSSVRLGFCETLFTSFVWYQPNSTYCKIIFFIIFFTQPYLVFFYVKKKKKSVTLRYTEPQVPQYAQFGVLSIGPRFLGYKKIKFGFFFQSMFSDFIGFENQFRNVYVL